MDNNIYLIVKTIIDSWDPMRFFPSAPPDEYESEIKRICALIQEVNLLDEKNSICKLAVSIGEICDSYDKLYDEKTYKNIAQKIITKIKAER